MIQMTTLPFSRVSLRVQGFDTQLNTFLHTPFKTSAEPGMTKHQTLSIKLVEKEMFKFIRC